MKRWLILFIAAILGVAMLPQPAAADHCREVLVFTVCSGDHDESEPTEEPSPSPSPTEEPGDTHSPPSTIAADCSEDATDQLQAWIDAQPDGTIWDFTDRCYRIDGVLFLNDRNDLTLNGGTFRAVTDGGEWQATHDSWRTQWQLERSHHITFTGMTVEGTNHDGQGWGTAPVSAEGQHNWTVKRHNTHITFDNVTGRQAWGDGICLCNAGTDAKPITDIIVANSTFNKAGRHGVSANFGERITIESNDFDTMRYGVDLEVEGAGWYIRDVVFRNNTMGAHRFYMLVAAVNGLPVTDVLIEGNKMLQVSDTCRGPIYSRGGEDARWTVRNNILRTRYSGVGLVDGQDHRVEGNTMYAEHTNCSAPTYGLHGNGSTGVYKDNALHNFDYLGDGLDGWQVSGNQMN